MKVFKMYLPNYCNFFNVFFGLNDQETAWMDNTSSNWPPFKNG